ncbi:MAG: ORF6N domain-containing protein [Dorea sp.]|jgi:hypothetical protein|nr:ORF6N domain-containing protein [Dorea sp.]
MADTEQTTLEKTNDNIQEVSIEPAQFDIKSMIYVVRNQQVMIDSDLAMLYQVETKRLNEAVKRNIARFPNEFRFQLTEKELESLRSQFATSNNREMEDGKKGGRRYLPYVFTEQGIAMLSAILRSDVAIQVSINIMKSFVEMRRFIANNALLFERISTVELRQLEYQKQTDEKLEQIFEYISEHADVGTLNLLSKKNSDVAVTIYTQKQTKLTKADVKNFNAQYPTLKIKYTKVFHDRFLILDRTTAYHVGASLKDAGKKCFGINLIQDAGIIKDILQRLKLETEE